MTNPVAPPPPPQGGPEGAYPPPGAAPEQAGGVPVEQKKSGGIGKKIAGILGVIVIGVVIFLLKTALFSDTDGTADAKPGDCVNNSTDAKETEVVACDNAAAAFKVTARIENISEAAFQADADGAVCKDAPTTTDLRWKQLGSKPGYVLCLEPNKK